jgi:hypothetical protein
MQDYRLVFNVEPGNYYPGTSEDAVNTIADALGILINYKLQKDSKKIAITASFSSLASILLAVDHLDIIARMLYCPAIRFRVYGEYAALQAVGQVGPGAHRLPPVSVSDIWDPWNSLD